MARDTGQARSLTQKSSEFLPPREGGGVRLAEGGGGVKIEAQGLGFSEKTT